ncbi:hypothetical protein [Parvibaculum sp.]|jgi:hypothetical protein|uniref:hypothetical protein n=1 Tax=Parvibaculum sp. TaxID=2024848 RepID=UPI001B11D3B1|nr:hypothetical protein [Parvibaculum sp.]MBO6636140.1 hypothetical protein [Parvibaculum sp.]MBO6680367.1 hypothetical protein [Parvibaculum sp.]MBO6685583.1 hypothetical protein [Parvibaculum sp.]MBO6905416.1 hypothetical protein [Parvibaculum sp.]
MLTTTLSWFAQNGRSSGVAVAFVAFLLIGFGLRPPEDLLQALAILLPSAEVAVFASVFAAVRDEEAHMLGSAFAATLWGSATFVAMWGLVEATAASVEAYVAFGLPPLYDRAQ